MTWDGAEDGPLSTIAPNNPSARKAISSHYYHGAAIPSFDRLQAWKNVATGFYFRGEPATFTRLLAADNGQSLFFAYDQRVVGGLVIGNSGTITAADVAYTQSLWPDVRLWRLAGALIYDGPFELRDVHFADFVALTADVPATPFYNIGGANRKIDRVTHVTFDGTAASRVVLWGDRLWADTPWATALRDDGSLSGAPGLLVPDHPMNASTGDCSRVTPNVAARGLLCRYDMGILQFSGSVFAPPYDAIRVPIRFERIERATGAIVSSDALAATELTNKAALIEGLRYTYRLSLSQPDARAMLIQWWWQPENGEPSPMLEIDGVARYNCHPSTASRQADSLAALDLATTTTYRYENGNLYMRLGPGVDSLKCDAPAQLATLGAP